MALSSLCLNSTHQVKLQLEASKHLRFASDKTMKISEELYSKGILSYPRTETERYGPDFDLMSLVRRNKCCERKIYRKSTGAYGYYPSPRDVISCRWVTSAVTQLGVHTLGGFRTHQAVSSSRAPDLRTTRPIPLFIPLRRRRI